MNVTSKQIVDVFTEWDRQWRKEPEKFQSTAEHLLKETPKTYGESAARTFGRILAENRHPNFDAEPLGKEKT